MSERPERALRVNEFQKLYGQDPFYAWLRLDDPLVYAAHKAAGNIVASVGACLL